MNTLLTQINNAITTEFPGWVLEVEQETHGHVTFTLSIPGRRISVVADCHLLSFSDDPIYAVVSEFSWRIRHAS